jgi:hypothetical protein
VSDRFSTANDLAVLQAGREPAWVKQPASGSAKPPDAADSGTYLERSVRGLIHVSLREQAHRRTARLTIPTVDLAATYTVTVDGHAVAYNAFTAGAVNRQAVVDGIAAAIAANGTVAAIVTANAVDALNNGARDTVVIRGIEEEDYAIAFTATGSAALLAVADLTTATTLFWWAAGARPGSQRPLRWVGGEELYELDYRGAIVRVDTAGIDRLHVQVFDRAGHDDDGGAVTYAQPEVWIGPALSELT